MLCLCGCGRDVVGEGYKDLGCVDQACVDRIRMERDEEEWQRKEDAPHERRRELRAMIEECVRKAVREALDEHFAPTVCNIAVLPSVADIEAEVREMRERCERGLLDGEE